MEIDPEKVAQCEGMNVKCGDYLTSDSSGDFGDDLTVVMNPPYRDAAEFVRAALLSVAVGRKVCALLRLNFLGSSSKRLDLFEWGSELRAVHVLARRPSFTGDGRSDACEYAWFVWESGYRGSALIDVVKP